MSTNAKVQLICDRCRTARWAEGKHDHHYGGMAYCRHYNTYVGSPTEVDLCQHCFNKLLIWLDEGKQEVARANSS
ncbi:MAG: hypothetical protein ACWGQW_00240 [bacterium]